MSWHDWLGRAIGALPGFGQAVDRAVDGRAMEQLLALRAKEPIIDAVLRVGELQRYPVVATLVMALDKLEEELARVRSALVHERREGTRVLIPRDPSEWAIFEGMLLVDRRAVHLVLSHSCGHPVPDVELSLAHERLGAALARGSDE